MVISFSHLMVAGMVTAPSCSRAFSVQEAYHALRVLTSTPAPRVGQRLARSELKSAPRTAPAACSPRIAGRLAQAVGRPPVPRPGPRHGGGGGNPRRHRGG